MKSSLFVVVAVAFVSAIMPSAQAAGWVTGYYPRWAVGDMPPREMTWRGLTHVVHFGAHPVRTDPYLDVLVNREDSLQLQFGNGWVWPPSSINVQESLIVHAHRNGVKVLLSVGGIWGEEAKTMDFIAEDDGRLATFVRASTAYARRKGYDGIEIDWEPPSSAKRLSAMLRAYREGLDRWPSRGTLTIAVANTHINRYDPTTCNDLLDQMNIMMYDYHLSPSWVTKRDISYYNAPLGPSSLPGLRGNEHYQNTGPDRWIKAGFLPQRLGIGIPFYAYCYKGIDQPGAPRGSAWPQYMPYRLVLEAMRVGGVEHWDSGAVVPYISGIATNPVSWYVSKGDKFYITHENVRSIREKMKWVAQQQVGGVMLYELWQGWVKEAPLGQKDPLLGAVRAYLGVDPISATRASKHDAAATASRSSRDPSDITERGVPIASNLTPTGIGNRDVRVISDGIVPNPGSNDAKLQYDTYGATSAGLTTSWIGYTFAEKVRIARMEFVDGVHFPDGGWGNEVHVEIFRDGKWVKARGLRVEPRYEPKKRGAFSRYVCTIQPEWGNGARLVFSLGGGSTFISASEVWVHTAE